MEAIPLLVAPAALIAYLYSDSQNTNNNKETFSGIKSNNNLQNTNVPIKNFPNEEWKANNDVRKYSGLTKNNLKPSEVFAVANQSGFDTYTSLTGETKNVDEIMHNNMKPYFGSNVTQSTDPKKNEGILDNYTGSGRNEIKKKESAPLFKPNSNMSWVRGMPSTTSFMQERMKGNLSMKVNNTKPWEEKRVAPGLNAGYGTEGSGGFNSGMEHRDKWMPKSVDQLRVDTNPKQSYKGQMLGKHVGRRSAPNAHLHNGMGKMEKNRPDTSFEWGKDRLFTTTGLKKGKTVYSQEMLKDENRQTTTREYFGVGESTNANGDYQKGVYKPSTKIELGCVPLGTATASEKWVDSGNNNYGKSGYVALPNSRTITGDKGEMGVVSRGLWAMVTPVLDVLRPTLKQNVEVNARGPGNARGRGGVDHARVWNPNDKPKTTIREQTENREYIQSAYKDYGNAHTMVQPWTKLHGQNRDTTNCEYVGNSSGSSNVAKPTTYNSAYNANLNPNKQVLSKVDRFHMGNTAVFTGDQNVTNLRNRATNEAQVFPNMPKSLPNMDTHGQMSGRYIREVDMNMERNDGNLLTAFNNNPYSHSLSSVA